MSGGATVALTAPSSGDYQGILFFQDRADTTAATLVGGTDQAMNGALYFPAAALSYTGGSSTVATATTIVAKTLSWSATPSLTPPRLRSFTAIPAEYRSSNRRRIIDHTAKLEGA